MMSVVRPGMALRSVTCAAFTVILSGPTICSLRTTFATPGTLMTVLGPGFAATGAPATRRLAAVVDPDRLD